MELVPEQIQKGKGSRGQDWLEGQAHGQGAGLAQNSEDRNTLSKMAMASLIISVISHKTKSYKIRK